MLVLGGASAIVGVVFLLRHLARQVDRLEQSELSLAAKNEELEAARSQLDAALSNITLGVCIFDGDKKLIMCNRRYRDLYNLTPEATKPGTLLEEIVDYRAAVGSLPNGTRDEYLHSCDAAIKGHEWKKLTFDLIGGRTILVTHQPMPHGGWIATHEDITEQREADREVRFLAHHDVLTELANRAAFAAKLEEAVARLRRHGEPFAIFMLDLDRFKDVNDTLGHAAGDQLLRMTAQRLNSSLRDTDLLARLGGDEFAIIQMGHDTRREAATSLAMRIVNMIAEPYEIDGNVVCVSASVGVALAPENSNESTDLLKMADLALYAAKSSGKNGFRFFDAEMLASRQVDPKTRLSGPGNLALSHQGRRRFAAGANSAA